ncbi:DNA repair protein [Vibrio chagasii]|nr:DNA repair protein [Vibrio chagasii]
MNIAGLRKIVLINSYQKKCLLSEYEVDAPAQLTGTNGAGKTSLLRLIPFFYGAEGRRIVRTSNVNKSFADWYLKHSNSYIVYEYTTSRGDVAHVYCFRNPNNKASVSYRFVKGSFDQAVVIKPDTSGKPNAIPSSQLAGELTEAGFDFEPLITSVKDYRHIIQNLDSSNISNNYLGYSLCSGRNDIKHVEKITAALIQGSFSMDDAKSLFLDILEKGDEALNFGIDATRIKEWCHDYNGLKAFLGKRDLFIEAISNNNKIVAITKYLTSGLVALSSEQGRLESLGASLNSKLEAMNVEHKENKASIEGAISDLKLLLVTDQDALTKVEASIQVEEDNQIDYEDNDLPSKVIAQDQLPQLKEQLVVQEERHKDLSEKVKDAEEQYNQRLAVAQNKYNVNRSNLRESESASQIKASKALNALSEQMSERKAVLDDEFNATNQKLNDAMNEAREQQATLGQRLKHPDIAPELLEAKDALQSEVVEITKQKAEHEKEFGLLSVHEVKLKQTRTALLSDLERVITEQKSVGVELELVAGRLDPDAGTLYAFLEANCAGWQDSPLGKVLNESALMSSDMHPKLVEGSATLFDLSVDTSSLPSSLVTNDSDLLKFESLSAKLESLSSQEKELRKSISSNQASIEEVEYKIIEKKTSLENALDALNLAQANLDGKIIAIRKAQEDLVAQIKVDLNAVKNQISQNAASLTKLADSYRLDKSNLSKERLEQQASIQSTESLELDALAEELAKLDKRFKTEKDSLVIEKEQRLSDQGVTQKIYAAYEQQINRLKEEIQSINESMEEVKEYKEWLKRYKVLMPKLREQQSEIASRISKNNKDYELDRTRLRAANEEHARNIASLEAQAAATKDHLEKVTVLTQELVRVCSDAESASPDDAFVYNGDLPSLINSISTKLSDYTESVKSRSKHINTMNAVTLQLGDGELHKFWKETQRSSSNDSSITTPEEQIKILEKIMDDIIPQVTRVTINSASVMGSMLVDFKDSLLTFDADIKRLGRSISDEVGRTNHFDIVDSIDINVNSSLSRLNGWGDILSFASIFSKWDQSGAQELPDMKFHKALEAVSFHITEDKLRKPTELFDIKFDVIENGQQKTAVTDKDMRDLASNGTNLLIQSMLYIALISKQRGANMVSISIPTDEIGKLTAENQAKLLGLMASHNFKVVAAQPDGNNQTASLFKHLYHITPERSISNKQRKTRLSKALDEEQNKEVSV